MRRAAVGRRGTLSMSIINKALLVLLLVICAIAARADGISNGGGTATVSGTVTVNQGTSPWVDSITTWGGGTLGAMANYGTSPGAVLVPGMNAYVTNQSGWAGGTLGAMANYGTSPGAVLSPGVNAFVTNTVAVTSTPSATVGVAYSVTAALASNKVVKGSAGNLYSFNVSADSTLSGAAWWIMIFDATSLPGDGGVTPAKCYAVPTGTTSYSASFNLPVAFTTGIVIGVSTTGCYTKTASTHAFISGDAQ